MNRTQRIRSWMAGAALLALALAVALLPAAAWPSPRAANLIGQRQRTRTAAPLPGATVTATNNDTGLDRVSRHRRATAPSASRRCRSASTPSRSSCPASPRSRSRTCRLNVATDRARSSRRCSASTVEETITVVDEAPLVADRRPSSAPWSARSELENLPLNGRQFANLAVLAPGTTLAYNSDPTKPGQLTVALNGGIGRNVNFIIDGGDNTDDTIGGALQNFNLESGPGVQHPDPAVQGRVRPLHRRRADGRHQDRHQRVRRQRLRLLPRRQPGHRRPRPRSSPASTSSPTSASSTAARSAARSSATGPTSSPPTRRPSATTSYTVDTGGVFPPSTAPSSPLPFEDELVTAKATCDISPKQFLQVRYGYPEERRQVRRQPARRADALGTLDQRVRARSSPATPRRSAARQPQRVPLPVHQLRQPDHAPTPNDPTIYFPSGVHTGQNINTPQTHPPDEVPVQGRLQLHHAPSAATRHDFKVGAQLHPRARRSAATSPPAPPASSPCSRTTRLAGHRHHRLRRLRRRRRRRSTSTAPTSRTTRLLNDRLTLNLGLRYDYWDGFDLDQRSTRSGRRCRTQTRFNEYYLRDFQGGKGGVLENDDDNFGAAPRLHLGHQGRRPAAAARRLRHLLRLPLHQRHHPLPGRRRCSRTTAWSTASTTPTGIRNPDGSFFQPGQPLPPNQLAGADARRRRNEVASPTLATPYSDQVSLGYSWQVNNWLGLNFEAVTDRLPRHPVPLPGQPASTQRRPGDAARFPQFGNFRLWYGDGEANYDGVNLELPGARQRQARAAGLLHLLRGRGQRARRRRRVPPHRRRPPGRPRRRRAATSRSTRSTRCAAPASARSTPTPGTASPWAASTRPVGHQRLRHVPLPLGARRTPSFTPPRDLNGDGFAFDLRRASAASTPSAATPSRSSTSGCPRSSPSATTSASS